ncbi:MAG: ABC transporter ATP-binding protein [Chloroflexi bacterium]|nr:ABC transporter ATP-binding protein [Chloroflexota bacterium]
MPNQASHLRLDHVTKRFGKVAAVERVSLDILRGSFTTLLGPSGCGKTTLLRMIAGFYEPDDGAIFLNDQRIDRLPAHKRGTAMVFQDYALWPHMTVFDNIAYGLRRRNVKENEIRERVIQTMELVEMPAPEMLQRRPSELSGGQQQRVALARALIVQPEVLLLDEPLSNLDAKVRQRLRVELRRLQKRINITTVYVTHDQEEALSLADIIVVMNQGRVVQIGAPREIYQKPASRFVAEFLGVSNVLRGRASADGKSVTVAGTTIVASLAPNANASVIFRAEDATLGAGNDNLIAFAGRVDEVLFVGATYRHYVVVGEEMILVDSPTPNPEARVTVCVPRDKIQVYAE